MKANPFFNSPAATEALHSWWEAATAIGGIPRRQKSHGRTYYTSFYPAPLPVGPGEFLELSAIMLEPNRVNLLAFPMYTDNGMENAMALYGADETLQSMSAFLTDEDNPHEFLLRQHIFTQRNGWIPGTLWEPEYPRRNRTGRMSDGRNNGAGRPNLSNSEAGRCNTWKSKMGRDWHA